ncbi:MAG: 2-oxoacid:ferredoxin oxidoreductase subunit beta [bacterium]|jgi:2-oxoglutarate ferredoxin oxidoreductase subunit beta
MPEAFLEKYLRVENLPTIWCSGCGLGTDMRSIVKAFEQCELDADKTVLVSGIGCSSRMPSYVDTNCVHTTHGRALAFATGIKLARPDLTVVVVMGDGDASAIGGNHLIHACRRNLDMTAIVLNNSNYGMTSGQYSPLTPHGSIGTTAPYGNAEQSFDLCKLAQACGATYVARSTTFHFEMITKQVVKAIKHKGFSFIEVISQCPTYFGRFNLIGTPADMLIDQKEHSIRIERDDGTQQGIVIGEFHEDTELPEYCEVYDGVIAKAKEAKAAKEAAKAG